MSIYYVCEYSNEKVKDRNLSFSPAGITKMEYMIKLLSSFGEGLIVYSTSRTLNKTEKYKMHQFVEGKINYIFRATKGRKNKVGRKLEFVSAKQKLFHLLMKLKKEDIVFVYHENYYLKTILFAHKIKKFNLVYEVEEIYHVAANNPQKLIDNEIKYLKQADKYVLSTELLNEYINKENKPNIIIHSSYDIENVIVKNNRFDDDKIHLVYAGTLEKIKAGAYNSIELAKYLDQNYVIHILGFGSEKEIQLVLNLIEQSNNVNNCKVVFEGVKTGEDYFRFLQKCQIGLSLQNPTDSFNFTSFPSKILVYLQNDLRVVSYKLPVLEKSSLSKYLLLCDYDNKIVAKNIKNTDCYKKCDFAQIISDLDKKAYADIQKLVK